MNTTNTAQTPNESSLTASDRDRVWFRSHGGTFWRLRDTDDEEMTELLTHGDIMQSKAIHTLRQMETQKSGQALQFRILTFSVTPSYVYRIPLLCKPGETPEKFQFYNVFASETLGPEELLQRLRRDHAYLVMSITLSPQTCLRCEKPFRTGDVTVRVDREQSPRTFCKPCAENEVDNDEQLHVLIYVEHEHVHYSQCEWPEKFRASFRKNVETLVALRIIPPQEARPS